MYFVDSAEISCLVSLEKPQKGCATLIILLRPIRVLLECRITRIMDTGLRVWVIKKWLHFLPWSRWLFHNYGTTTHVLLFCSIFKGWKFRTSKAKKGTKTCEQKLVPDSCWRVNDLIPNVGPIPFYVPTNDDQAILKEHKGLLIDRWGRLEKLEIAKPTKSRIDWLGLSRKEKLGYPVGWWMWLAVYGLNISPRNFFPLETCLMRKSPCPLGTNCSWGWWILEWISIFLWPLISRSLSLSPVAASTWVIAQISSFQFEAKPCSLQRSPSFAHIEEWRRLKLSKEGEGEILGWAKPTIKAAFVRDV